ncbi:MAG: class I SAM-dependent methyltransferase [Verrucomicrobiota bacterium]|jgi:SAM-dependent methyltransferase
MQTQTESALKEKVREFWNRQSCDTQVAQGAKFSLQYFEEIERFRYFDQPFIHSFAQFTRYHGKRVLEVGFGAGTDFIQWLRAGACVSGIDLTDEALANVTRRMEVYGLQKPETLRVADAEHLPFQTGTFDLGYSFGVLHHAPDTEKALAELVRVIRPGGELKIMLYNRWSVFVVNRWVKFALLKGCPWKNLRWILWHHNESIGTKGYTRRELVNWLVQLPLEHIQIHTEITAADALAASAFPPLNWAYRLAMHIAGWKFGWHPSQYVYRADAEEPDRKVVEKPVHRDPKRPLLTGNPLGFFHCISAVKTG